MEPVAVKAFYGDDVRRFTIDGSAKFAEMMVEVTKRFNLTEKNVMLKFKDDEGEMCTFTSDEELLEAVRIARQSVPPILRVQIIVHVEATEPPTAGPVDAVPVGEATMQAWSQYGPAAWSGFARGGGKWGKGRQGCPPPEMEWGKGYEMPGEEEFGPMHGGRGGGKKGKGKGKGPMHWMEEEEFGPMHGCRGGGKEGKGHEMDEEDFGPFRGGKFGGRGGGKFGKGGPRGWCKGKGASLAGPHSARFVADVNLPDGALVVPGSSFTKTWRLRNDGDLAWPAAAGLVFVKGDVLHQDPVQHVGSVEPGQEVDVSIALTAPAVAGRFISYWRLSADAESERNRWHPRLQLPFGQRVWAQIVVTDDGSVELTGEEDSVSGNVRAAVRSLPGYLSAGAASVGASVANRVVGASVSVVEKLDEATGASVQITKLNDTLSSTTCLQAGTAIVEKFDEATGASAQINKLNDTLSSAIRGTPPGSPKLADTVAGASAPTDAVHAAEPPLSAEEMRDLIEQDVAMACSESAPRPAAPFEFARGNTPLEVSAPTDVRHLGPDECIALLTQQQAEAEATKGRAAIPETGLFEPAVLVPQDPSEEPTEVPTEAPEPMTESLIADIARVHASEMVQLKEMGFTDEDRIRAVLEAANGDVIAAVEMLSDK